METVVTVSPVQYFRVTADGDSVKDVMTPGSQLLQKMADILDHRLAIKDWRHLACKLDVPVDVWRALEQKRKSPIKELLQRMVVQGRNATWKDLLKAPENIQCYDAIQIIRRQFPDTVGESKIFLFVTLYLLFSISLV